MSRTAEFERLLCEYRLLHRPPGGAPLWCALQATGASPHVHYETAEAAGEAIAKINGMKICDKEVYVGHFVRRNERPGQVDWTNCYVKNFPPKNIEIKPGKSNIIPTGLAVAIPKDFEIQIRPRSGLAAKNQISVLNTPGTIDADYRGELKIILINLSNKSFIVEKGLRIAQMVLCPVVKAKFKEVESLDDTKRGSGGFGSTGAK